MKIIIGGALGRMGREVAEAAKAAGITVAAGVDVIYRGEPMNFPMATDYDRVSECADVMIDFSRADGLPDLLSFCVTKQMPCVVCATGHNDVEVQMIAEASGVIPIFRSANMSLGVNVMEQLVAMAAKALGEVYDIEIVKKHHRMKMDSPSGTAFMLYESVRKAMEIQATPAFGRYGRRSIRQKGDVGLHAVRGGTMTGEHEVSFLGEGEQLILTHRAENRALFAQGALRAAKFLTGKPAGLYSMRDLVTEMLQ